MPGVRSGDRAAGFSIASVSTGICWVQGVQVDAVRDAHELSGPASKGHVSVNETERSCFRSQVSRTHSGSQGGKVLSNKSSGNAERPLEVHNRFFASPMCSQLINLT